MFPHAHHFKVTNSTFNYTTSQDTGTIQDITKVLRSDGVLTVSTVLHQYVASAALIDSSDRFPPGRCHPGTRERIIQKVNDWINDPSPPKNVLWLYGAAGSGKSALAHSIAELLRQHNPERYGGSFFFARGPTDRGRGDKFFSTLAYQLALQIPPMRNAINDALAHDPILPTKSIDYQLERLILGPARLCLAEWPLHTPTVFIDGLDECGDVEEGSDTQCTILALISEAITKHTLPIRFFIASRPEYWIRDSFEIGAMKSLAVHVSLRDDVDADRDMKKYLQHGFEEIRMKNLRVMRSVETPWPSSRIIDRIVEEASGQYIYASTVLKFIGKASRYCDPQEQLRILTTPGPHRASAFSDLNKLYATVLSAYPRPESLLCVLGGLLVNASLCTIRVCLGVDETEMTLVLDALSSLINISEPELEEGFVRLMEPIFGSPLEENRITFFHLSFREFLADESRSGQFFVDQSVYPELIGRKLLKIIEHNLNGRYETEPHMIYNLGMSIFNRMMAKLRGITECSENTLITVLSEITQKIQEFLPIVHIHYPTCLMRDMACLQNVGTDILYHKEQPSRKLASIVGEMLKTVDLAILSARNSLCDSDHFKLTPTIARIDLSRHECGDTGRMDPYSLLNDTADSREDTLLSLQMHRRIIDTESFLHSGEWYTDVRLFGITLISSIQDYKGETHGWLSREEWGNAYVVLLYKYLESFLRKDVSDNFGQIGMINTLLWSARCLRFLSPVTSEEIFRRSHKVPIFKLLFHNSSRTRLLSPLDNSNYSRMIQGLLQWLHSEMTNPIERDHIRKHDAALPDSIIKTMRELFDRFFFPENLIQTPFFLYDHIGSTAGRFPLEFRSPLEDTGEPVIVQHSTISDLEPSRHIFRNHDELYQKLFGGASTEEPILYPISNIYPRLATFALRALVKHQASFRPQEYHHNNYDTHYITIQNDARRSYLFRCLSYAHPTQENLASLRALRYIDENFPEHRCWLPPVGFCVSISGILNKFQPPDLSKKELERFQFWLENLQKIEKPLEKFDLTGDWESNYGARAAPWDMVE